MDSVDTGPGQGAHDTGVTSTEHEEGLGGERPGSRGSGRRLRAGRGQSRCLPLGQGACVASGPCFGLGRMREPGDAALGETQSQFRKSAVRSLREVPVGGPAFRSRVSANSEKGAQRGRRPRAQRAGGRAPELAAATHLCDGCCMFRACFSSEHMWPEELREGRWSRDPPCAERAGPRGITGRGVSCASADRRAAPHP